MTATADVLTLWLCPAAGVVIITLLFCSPLKSVLEIDKRQTLGETNALPYAVMLVTSVSWMLYGILVHNYFIYCGNVAGMILGMHYTMVCYKYCTPKAQNAMAYFLVGACALFFVIGLISMAASMEDAGIKTLWGSVSVAWIVLFYASPLATVAKVLREHDSSSLHWTLCSMNTINGGLWFVYGLAVKDWFVTVPNGVGVAFNLLCVILCLVFPRTAAASGSLGPSRVQADRIAADVHDKQDGDLAKAAEAIASDQVLVDATGVQWQSAFAQRALSPSGPCIRRLASDKPAAKNAELDIEAGDQGQLAARPSSASGSDGRSSSAAATRTSSDASGAVHLMARQHAL